MLYDCDMDQKRCPKCGKLKPIGQFNWKKKGIKRQSHCKVCQALYTKAHYKKNPAPYRSRAAARKKTAMEFVMEYLRGSKCIDCGTADVRVLEFDHVRDKKSGNIMTMARSGKGISSIETEIAKCEIRCANCHRVRHNGDSWRGIA